MEEKISLSGFSRLVQFCLLLFLVMYGIKVYLVFGQN